MWFLPFLAGAASTWFALETFRQREQDAMSKIDHKIDELKAELFPQITSQATSALRQEVDRVKVEFLPFVKDLIKSMRPKMPGFGALDWRVVMSQLPGVSEALAMYFAMIDPQTSWSARMEVAAALTYLLTPDDWLPDSLADGDVDDVAVLMYAYGKVQEHVKPEHVARARSWLAGNGVTDVEISEPMRQLEAFGDGEEEDPDDVYVFEEETPSGTYQVRVYRDTKMAWPNRYGTPSGNVYVYANKVQGKTVATDDPEGNYAQIIYVYHPDAPPHRENQQDSFGAIEHAFHTELRRAKSELYGGMPWENPILGMTFSDKARFAKLSDKVERLTNLLDKKKMHFRDRSKVKTKLKRLTRERSKLRDKIRKERKERSSEYGSNEWQKYIVSGHRAPSHALPQFRRMGGRFYG